jgi:L-methionine (R)-S-oxide reductase
MIQRPANDIPSALLEYLDAQILQRTDDWHTVLTRTVEALAEAFEHYQWTGVYLVDGDGLVLGPYVGLPTAHTRITFGTGICGAAAAERTTIIVDDVTQDSRYLACSLTTRSEIVVPILDGSRVVGEIDVDSDRPAAFGDADQAYLEEVAAFLARLAPPAPGTEARDG